MGGAAAVGGGALITAGGVVLSGGSALTVGEAAAIAGAAISGVGTEAYVVGTLTTSQIQALIRSSGGQVVTVFTKLASFPDANRLLYTATSPKLCNQIAQGCLYAGKIPQDLFRRLLAEGLIREETAMMGGVVETVYVIEAQAMPLLQQYFKCVN